MTFYYELACTVPDMYIHGCACFRGDPPPDLLLSSSASWTVVPCVARPESVTVPTLGRVTDVQGLMDICCMYTFNLKGSVEGPTQRKGEDEQVLSS